MDFFELFNALPVQVRKYHSVSGGDINKAYFLEAEEGNFFVKLNRAFQYPEMLKKEASGLQAILETQTLKIPEVIECKEQGNIQYLLLEWIERGNANEKTWNIFGKSLALMHQIPQPYFGFTEDNYLGTLKQKNPKCITWKELYGRYHIFPLAKQLIKCKQFNTRDIQAVENFCDKLEEIFPSENPSLLHGDLWNGNFMVSNKQEVYLIDSAVYYGHREMDLGMTKLFGGFSPIFYQSYNEVYPLEKGWEKRLPYTQIYPLLLHALLFGGYYVTEVKNCLKPFYN